MECEGVLELASLRNAEWEIARIEADERLAVEPSERVEVVFREPIQPVAAVAIEETDYQEVDEVQEPLESQQSFSNVFENSESHLHNVFLETSEETESNNNALLINEILQEPGDSHVGDLSNFIETPAVDDAVPVYYVKSDPFDRIDTGPVEDLTATPLTTTTEKSMFEPTPVVGSESAHAHKPHKPHTSPMMPSYQLFYEDLALTAPIVKKKKHSHNEEMPALSI